MSLLKLVDAEKLRRKKKDNHTLLLSPVAVTTISRPHERDQANLLLQLSCRRSLEKGQRESKEAKEIEFFASRSRQSRRDA